MSMQEADYGPQMPTFEELWAAQAAPYDAHAAGCDDATYDQLVAARAQTEAAFLVAEDRRIGAALEAE